MEKYFIVYNDVYTMIPECLKGNCSKIKILH